MLDRDLDGRPTRHEYIASFDIFDADYYGLITAAECEAAFDMLDVHQDGLSTTRHMPPLDVLQ